MDRADEERKQQGESGRHSQPHGQGFYGPRSNYYESIEQGGGSVTGEGGSGQTHLQHNKQGGEGMDIAPMHLSGLIPTYPHPISQDKGLKTGAESCAKPQLQRGSEHQSQYQRCNDLPKDLGATQVKPDAEVEGLYRNPIGTGTGFGVFPVLQTATQSAGGERYKGGEQWFNGRRGPEMPQEGSVRVQEQGMGGRRGDGSSRGFSKHEPGDVGFATHRDVDGPHLYEMEGVGRREPGRDLLAHRVYSPVPTATGGTDPECTQHGPDDRPDDIGGSAHRDFDGPHLYEMEGVGRREEGRAQCMRGRGKVAKDTSDIKD